MGVGGVEVVDVKGVVVMGVKGMMEEGDLKFEPTPPNSLEL